MSESRPFKTNEELVWILIDERGLACEDPSSLLEAIVGKLVGDLARAKSPDIARHADEGVKGDNVAAWCRRYRDVPIWDAVELTTFGRIANMVECFADREAVKAASVAKHCRKKIDGDTSVADEIAALLDENPVYAAGIYQPKPKSFEL